MNFHELPEHCYYKEPVGEKVVIIQKGMLGFKPCKLENGDVNVLNKSINVTSGIVHIMLCGSLRGFEYVENNWSKLLAQANVIDNLEDSEGMLLYLSDTGTIQKKNILYTQDTDIKRVDLLNCELVTVVSLSNNIDIWCDDTGLWKEKNHVITLKIEDEIIQLAGNLLFLGQDGEGGTMPLSEEQFRWLDENMKHQRLPKWITSN
ncbi:DUF3846 domain-containing protein [Listeria seeligeri]|nr:hypothetical protein [Listeria seeligeri]MBC1817167.1 hypothetical protein [Listeria seeligeri]